MFYSERDFLRFLPKVLRARDFHLYLENGKRLTDLWLAGGRAVLGHKPPRVLSELKNAAERGLFAPLPHPMERRFLKALGDLFPGRAFRLYADAGALYRALEGAGKEASLWRPFADSENEAPILAPVLPWPLGPEALVLEKGLDASFPAGDLISPVILAAATRALYDLLAVIRDGSRVARVYPKVEKAIKDGSWRRRGIYLTVKVDSAMDAEKHSGMFRRFLEGGFLIPPSPMEPLILPASMSDGEEAKLAGLLRG